MTDLVGSFEDKITSQRQERIKRLMQIDEQVMKLQEDLLHQVESSMQPTNMPNEAYQTNGTLTRPS